MSCIFMKYPEELQTLISTFQKLPGVGKKTAERFAFDTIGWKEQQVCDFGTLLLGIQKKVPPCPTCGCLSNAGACSFCDPSLRDGRELCILASARDVYSIEQTRSYKGLYHVVEHLLSPLDGRHASGLKLEKIDARLDRNPIEEIIIAFDSTLEGDATALYLKEHLSQKPVKITRLAFGLPVGSPLDHIDGGTLLRAIAGRQRV